MGLLTNITFYQDCFFPCFLYIFCSFFGIFSFLEIGYKHIGSFTSKSNCNGPAYSGISSCNNSLFAIQFSRALIGFLSMIRFWIHLLFLSRNFLFLFRIRRLLIFFPGIVFFLFFCLFHVLSVYSQ